MPSPAQTATHVLRKHLNNELPAGTKPWWKRTLQGREFFYRMRELKIPMRLPCHTLLHHVVRNSKIYHSWQILTCFQTVLPITRQRTHPNTISSAITSLINAEEWSSERVKDLNDYVRLQRHMNPDGTIDPKKILVGGYHDAAELLHLAFRFGILPLPHRLYHNLIQRFLLCRQYTSATLVYSLLLHAQGASINRVLGATEKILTARRLHVIRGMTSESGTRSIEVQETFRLITSHLIIDAPQIEDALDHDIPDANSNSAASANEEFTISTAIIYDYYQAIANLTFLATHKAIPRHTLEPFIAMLTMSKTPATFERRASELEIKGWDGTVALDRRDGRIAFKEHVDSVLRHLTNPNSTGKP